MFLNGLLGLAHLFVIGGANLVGSDLYKKLYAYFVAHFKPMTEVCTH